MQSPILQMGPDVSILFKYEECAIKTLHSVGFLRIQEGSLLMALGVRVKVEIE